MALGGETVGHAFVKLHIDGDGLDREIRRELRKQTPKFIDAGDEQGDAYGEAFTSSFLDRFRNALGQAGDAEDRFAVGSRRRWGQIASNVDLYRDRLHLSNRTLDSSNRSASRFSDTLGRMFGRGSRNNFLNLLGSMTRGIGRLGESMGTLPTKIISLSRTFETFLSTLGKGGKGGGGAGAAGAAGVVGAVVVLTETFGILASALSGIAGIITAVTSTLTFGLIGALTAAGGAAFYFGAGLGVVALAIANLSDAQKKALEPIADQFQRLGNIAAESFGPALVRNVDGITEAMRRLEPVVRVVGDAMGHVLDDFVASLNGPAWRSFTRTFRREGPGIIEDLGASFTNLGETFAGVLRAATPLVQRFAGWLEQATQDLSDWVNSTKGQNRLKKFFDDAGDAASVVGDVIGELTEALFVLFDAGNKSGQNILGSLADALERFSTWAKSKEGQKALQDWFAFAEDLAGKLGTIFVSVLDFLDDMDTPEHRNELLTTLDVVNELIRALDRAFVLMDRLVHLFAIPSLTVTLYAKVADFVLPDKVDWRRVIPDVSWSEFIPDIGPAWARFANSLKWSRIIPDVRWSEFIPDVKWSQFIPFDVNWSAFIPRVNWGWFIPDVKWSNFVPHISWGDLVPDISWSDIIPDVDWDDFVPDLNIDADINWPNPPGWLSKLSASGGVFSGAQTRIIGEAGPEAVVPLNRPLNMVDPSVRSLSAFAQGLTTPVTRGGAGRANQTNNFYVNTPTRDPGAVASEVMNRLAVAGY